MAERFLVTGAMGCIGSWTLKVLLDEGVSAVGLDLSAEPRRLRLLVDEAIVQRVTWVTGDLRDPALLKRLIQEHQITHVIHLAALQVPLCKADPALCAQVNVAGTVNVFEAVLANRDQVEGVVYASSGAVFGSESMYEGGVVRDDSTQYPDANLYGVFKHANEGTARIYARDHGLASVGLRPFVAYGVGRDQGLTAQPSLAMAAAASGRPYTISHSGYMLFQLAEDLGRVFVAAARSRHAGTACYNIGGTRASIPEVVEAIAKASPESDGQISYTGAAVDSVSRVDSSGLKNLIGDFSYTPLSNGVERTIARYKSLVSRGQVVFSG